MHLDRDGHVVPLTVFPRDRLFHTPLPLDALYNTRFDTVRLLQVERALLQSPVAPPGDMVAPKDQCHPLGGKLFQQQPAQYPGAGTDLQDQARLRQEGADDPGGDVLVVQEVLSEFC